MTGLVGVVGFSCAWRVWVGSMYLFNAISTLPLKRHDPLYAGHPRLYGAARKKGVDGPAILFQRRPGHDGFG